MVTRRNSVAGKEESNGRNGFNGPYSIAKRGLEMQEVSAS